MSENNPFLEMMKRHRPVAEVDRDAISFVEQALAQHCNGNGAKPVVFVRDSHQGEFYEKVRDEIRLKTDRRGMFKADVGGKSRMFRFEDCGESFMTFHPQPEPSECIIPHVEVPVIDHMVLTPWRC